MAAGKKSRPPAPIDRPLSKAYLREFTGWSTAYPPGTSDPTSLRVMHNCNLDTDASLRIRPGMRRVVNVPAHGDIVGSFEHFYSTDGKKCILFAYRDTVNNRVTFQTATYNSTTHVFDMDPSITTRFPGATHADLAFTNDTTYVKYVQIDNKILALSDNSEAFRMFWVGSSPKAKRIRSVPRPDYNATDRPVVLLPTAGWISGAQTTVPTAETPTGSTLISSTAADNVYNFGYFYTFNNEIGESASSMVQWVKTQRRWSAWNANPADDTKSTDQLAMVIPSATWTAAVAAGAVSWNLYMLTWSDQDSVPPEGVLLKVTDMQGKTRDQAGWATHTPLLQGRDALKALPNRTNRDNFSEPSAAGQGVVAGDRLVLVYDKTEAARIRWTSNQQGDYLNFSAALGGGFKTLTSGNLFFPASVKLWQNPQSADTLTVLCMGLDGYGTSYYMNPGTSITTQSQATSVMGFEETTATPGTVSPYGCEVLNNALYHPLDNNLMKSTASNYNINHAMMADSIQNLWHQIKLADKRKVVSSQMDSTLYYLIKSPVAWHALEPGMNGNQVWLCDTAQTNAWSCWDVGGTSLRKLEIDGLLYMGITSGRFIYVFDPEQDHDDIYDDGVWEERGIRWEAVTNTQGANRAHDAWAMLQQANVTFGNFTGECVYGIRGVDVHGRMVEVTKHYVAPQRGHDPLDRYDQEDMLLVQRAMKEWEFFWRSAPRPKNRSYGSIGFVQYRYTPLTVNPGYEEGSVETFEYRTRAETFSNGVALPGADTRKP